MNIIGYLPFGSKYFRSVLNIQFHAPSQVIFRFMPCIFLHVKTSFQFYIITIIVIIIISIIIILFIIIKWQKNTLDFVPKLPVSNNIYLQMAI